MRLLIPFLRWIWRGDTIQVSDAERQFCSLQAKKDRLVLRTKAYRINMIPSVYQTALKRQLNESEYLLLSVLVTLLQTIRHVRIETLAEALPMPILFESRRKKSSGSLRWGCLI